MSRIAHLPIPIPNGVDVKVTDTFYVKGAKGEQQFTIPHAIRVWVEDNTVRVKTEKKDKFSGALSGTIRALANNAVIGVSRGFEKKLQLVGVGYRVKLAGKKLELNVGFSHPVNYELPDNVKAATPSQTEIVLTSVDKQALGQVATEIRSVRKPEPYKGKGIRYVDEHIVRKESKKSK